MSKRFQINVRSDKETNDLFESQVEQSKLTKIGYIKKMLKDASQGKTLELLYARLKSSEKKVEEQEVELKRIKEKYEIKTPSTRRVTFKVTDEQFTQLTKMAHKLEIPKNQLMSKFFLVPNKDNKKLMLE